MSKRYIITLTAANRVGILAAVTTALDELGANLVEVNQTVVQRFFTLILAADFPEQRNPEVIVGHIRDIGRPYGIAVSLKDPADETLQHEAGPSCGLRYLSLRGTDRPGVLRLVSTILAQHEIDIADLHATRQDDQRSFCIALRLTVPEGVDLEAVTSELLEKGRSIELSATWDPENSVPGRGTSHPMRFAPPMEA